MQASGVAVADDCVTTFNELKLKHSLKFIVYGMNDAMTEIQVLNLVLQLTFKVCLLTRYEKSMSVISLLMLCSLRRA